MKRTARAFAAIALSVGLLGIAAQSAQAEVRASALKIFKLNLNVKNGKNKTLLLVSESGRTLDSVKVTRSPQKVQFMTDGKNKVSSIAGATIQIVSSNGGDYYGPVVLGWKKNPGGKPISRATTVYTKLKASTRTSLALGTITVTNAAGTTKQGYGKPSANSVLVDTSAAAAVRATGGKPKGVGNYGKSSTSSQEIGAFALDFGPLVDPCGAPPAPPCEPGGGETVPDDTLGGDKDDDGIPNAFDVNDDGDAKVDSADSTTPTPQADIENAITGADCSAIEFRIFTNFKSTSTTFAGTINAYGIGDFQASVGRSQAAITRSMTMVFSKIESVCNSTVTKTEIKGIGVPYAPTMYTELENVCGTGDYQFSIGSGKVCAGNGMEPGPDEFALTEGYDFEAEGTLPSGQDTFQIKLTTEDGGVYEVTSSAGFVFVTHPMVVAYGTSLAGRTNVDYTLTQTGPEGTRLATEPTIAVSQGETLYLLIYRPQRLAIDGEDGPFYDLGGFRYTPDVPNYPVGGSGPSLGKCDVLTTTDGAVDVEGVDDAGLANDQPTNPDDPPMLVLKWDLSQCLTAKGMDWEPETWDFDIQVEPAGPGGNSAQKVKVIFNEAG
jgi:hypothetical protein